MEARILATLFALETRAEDWWDGKPGALTDFYLRGYIEKVWFEAIEPEIFEAALSVLERRGLLRQGRGEVYLTPEGRGPAKDLRDAFRRQRFADVLVQAEQSATYRTFCLRTSDLDLRAFSPLDGGQLEAVLSALDLRPGDSLLDAGCGAGHVAERIHELTGAAVVGLDVAEAAIELARTRCSGKPGLRFEVQDLAELDSEAENPDLASHDAALAMDSLAFLDDLPAALAALIARLRPGGVFVILTLEATSDAEDAPTAAALTALAMPFTQIDLTAQVTPLLRSRQFAARALHSNFRQEGHGLLGRVLAQEGERLESLLASGLCRRFLYRVGPVWRASEK